MKNAMIWMITLSALLVSQLSSANPYSDKWDYRTYTKKDADAFDNKSADGDWDLFSILLGANFSSVSGIDGSSGPRKGVKAGAYVDLGTKDLVFETGIIYQELGMTERLLRFPNGGVARSELNLEYLSFPFTAKYYLSGRQNTTFYLKGGVLYSLLLSQQARQQSTTTYYEYNVNKQDFGPYLGVGKKININNQLSLRFEASYYRGLTSIAEHIDAYNQNFGISFGVGF